MNTRSKTDKTAQGKPELPECDHKEMVRNPVGKNSYWMCAKCFRPYGLTEAPHFGTKSTAHAQLDELRIQRDEARNHAQALAEALRITAGVLRHCNGQFEATKEIITEALARWEAAQ